MVIREAIQILLHERDWLTLSIYVSRVNIHRPFAIECNIFTAALVC